VLPALYLLFEGKVKISPNKAVMIAGLVLVSIPSLKAQNSPVNINQAINIALHHNLQATSARLNERAENLRRQTGFDIPKTQFSADYGQINSVQQDNRFGITQSLSFPTVYTHQKKALQENYLAAQAKTQMMEQDIRTNVRRLFYDWVWLHEKQQLLQYADSIYRLFEEKTNLRFRTGETNILEKTTAESHRQQIANQLEMLSADMEITLKQFNLLLGDSVAYQPQTDSIRITYATVDTALGQLPQIRSLRHESAAAHWRWRTEKSKLLPDFFIGYNNQSISGIQNVDGQETYFSNSKRFNYVNAGISIPLFFGAQRSRASAAQLDWQLSQQRADYALQQARTESQTALTQVQKYAASLHYYQGKGLENAAAIIFTADKQFVGGEIDYLQWVMLTDQAIGIRNEYLDMLNNYNQAAIQVLRLQNL